MAVIAASAVRSCLGDGAQTFARLLAGDTGVEPLRYVDAKLVNVKHGYHLPGKGNEPDFGASQWLAECVAEVLAVTGLTPRPGRVPVLVGTGLRELRSVERWATEGLPVRPGQLDFAEAVQAVHPNLGPVITISNACSASGHALALAQDMIRLGTADAVIAAGADAMTASMLAMIGRVTEEPTTRVRPFDVDRTGVLLGEGAAAVLVAPDDGTAKPLGRLLGTHICCDAFHETAPSLDGIIRAMKGALAEAQREPSDVDLVVSHGTGTALNDVTEAQAIQAILGDRPWVTGIKGSLGHTSGASALMSVDVALRCLADGKVPAVAGLTRPVPEAAGLRLATGPVAVDSRVALVNSFGFGGVNAVTVIGAP